MKNKRKRCWCQTRVLSQSLAMQFSVSMILDIAVSKRTVKAGDSIQNSRAHCWGLVHAVLSHIEAYCNER